MITMAILVKESTNAPQKILTHVNVIFQKQHPLSTCEPTRNESVTSILTGHTTTRRSFIKSHVRKLSETVNGRPSQVRERIAKDELTETRIGEELIVTESSNCGPKIVGGLAFEATVYGNHDCGNIGNLLHGKCLLQF